jgi:hypothetical protein
VQEGENRTRVGGVCGVAGRREAPDEQLEFSEKPPIAVNELTKFRSTVAANAQ